MVALSLKICVRQCNVVKTMQFEPSTAVYDACRVIRERVPEAQTGQGEFLYLSLVNSLAELKISTDPWLFYCSVPPFIFQVGGLVFLFKSEGSGVKGSKGIRIFLPSVVTEVFLQRILFCGTFTS